jgi:hypothetical protein
MLIINRKKEIETKADAVTEKVVHCIRHKYHTVPFSLYGDTGWLLVVADTSFIGVDNIPVVAGEYGGLVGSGDCLSQTGRCWVRYGGIVEKDSRVVDDAVVSGIVRGRCLVGGRAIVTRWGEISDNVRVLGNAIVDGRYISSFGDVLGDGQRVYPTGEIGVSIGYVTGK